MNFRTSAMFTCTVPSSFGQPADVARGHLEVRVLLEALGGDHVPEVRSITCSPSVVTFIFVIGLKSR